jgi:hypothetical protein
MNIDETIKRLHDLHAAKQFAMASHSGSDSDAMECCNASEDYEYACVAHMPTILTALEDSRRREAELAKELQSVERFLFNSIALTQYDHESPPEPATEWDSNAAMYVSSINCLINEHLTPKGTP